MMTTPSYITVTSHTHHTQKKCEQYWPDKVGETLDPHNGLMVTMISHVPFSDFIIRNLKLAKVSYTYCNH